MLGWHPLLCAVGYTIDYDGIPVYYKEHLSEDPVNLDAFTELFFWREPTEPDPWQQRHAAAHDP